MRYLVIENYIRGSEAVYARAAQQGRMLPDGLAYIDSWVDAETLDRCFQLMEADEPSLFDEWIADWNDIVEFEIVPVISSSEAAERAGRSVGSIDREAGMALARVVTFEGVSKDRMDEMDREMREGQPPEGFPAAEFLVLHDPEAEKSLVIIVFETEDDYKKGDEILSAMPAGDTPGRRTSVTKYNVATRMTP